MKKNKTKSILACAVLASVLAGGMVPSAVFANDVPQEVDVNAVVAPKDFSTLNGKSITFGQAIGFVENKQVTALDQAPTWQIVAGDNGSITLFANQVWGYNRFSDANTYDYRRDPGATVEQYFYREVLKYLNDNVFQFFSAEELSVLHNQTSAEECHKAFEQAKTEYFGIFALPTWEQVINLTQDNRKRSSAYWLNDYEFVKNYLDLSGRTANLFFLVQVVQTDGSIIQQHGEDAKHIYPTIAFNKPIAFAYYNEKVQSNTFGSQEVSEDTTIKNFTFEGTGKEKNVNITKLSVTQEGITFDAAGLATGDGQGIGGLVEDASGNYLAYARLANSTDGTVKNVEIKFDSSITGNNTIHLFNEWIGDKYDLIGNYYEMYVKTENAKISAFTNKRDVTYDELTIGKGVNYIVEGNSNFTVRNKFVWENSNEEKLVNITNVDNGYIHLGGAFSVDNLNDTTVTNRTLKLTKTADVWNDIELYGINDGVMAMNVDLNSLYMERGTFNIQGILKVADYLQLRNGAELTIGGTVEAKRLEVNGVLNLVDGAVTGETHLCNNSTLNLTGSDKTLNLQKSLTADDGAKITGIDSTDKVVIDENLTAKGNITLENVTLEVGENIQVQGNLNGDAVISADKIDVKGNLAGRTITSDVVQAGGTLNATELKVRDVLNVANGNAQSGTIDTLIFGESGKTAIYAFDVGMDKFTITNSTSGKVKLVPKYGTALNVSEPVVVFDGSGNFNDLTIHDARVTDMTNKQTYFLTQNTSNKGQLKVTASKHKNAVMNFADAVKGQKIVLGNYWQEDGNTKQPVLWSCVKQDNGQSVFLSEKILAETGGWVGDDKMWKITNFLKQDGAFVKELFTTNELALLNVVNGDALGLPSFDDVKDGGNYGWNADGRKAEATLYAGNGGRYYAISSVHLNIQGLNCRNYINDWVDSLNGDIGTSESLYGKFSDGSHYGIRPTISFDTYSVLFATNAEGGKGSVAEGELTRLKDVESNSTLELTFDDAYLAEKKGTARLTGDIALSSLALDGGSVSVDYSNAKFADSNSFVSLFVGEGDMPQDYFGYAKTKASIEGNGTATVDLGSFANGTDTNGYVLTFFNEYGNGTSLAGKFNVLPGVLKVEGTDKHLTYTIAADKLTQDVQLGKNNVVELTGTGTLTKNITGEGKVSVNGNITANGDSMQADFETVGSSTIMKINGGNVKGSLNGKFYLMEDTGFSGKSLQGYIFKLDSAGDKKLKLNNDVQINNRLEIANLDGNGKTMNMQQTDVTTTYETLTINKLWSNVNLAVDVGETGYTSDQIELKGVENDAKIILTAFNLLFEPGLTVVGNTKTVYNLVSGSKKGNVAVATGLELYGTNNIYTASLSDGNLILTYKEANTAGFRGFLENANGSSYSFRDAVVFLGKEGETDADYVVKTVGADYYTKTVFMNGKTLNGYGMNNRKIIIDGTNHHTLTLINGKITNFDTALTVEEGATLILQNVEFPKFNGNFANNIDVQNNGTMNIRDTARIYRLAGSGTTNIIDNGILYLHSEGDLSQKFSGNGLLQLEESVTIAADNLAVAEASIAAWKTLTLTGGADAADRQTLQSTVKGSGTIEIGSGNFVEADASKLGVAVENNGDLKLGSSKEMILQKDITGTGNLEFAQNTRINSTVTQGAITVDENVAIDVYKDLTANSGSITNNGSILIDIDNLKNNVNNSANGAVYLRNLGTEASKTLTKTINNGKVIVMKDVISSLQNLATGTTGDAGVYLAGGANLTLRDGGTLEIGINIKGYGSGAGTLITDCDGSTGTGYFYRATMDNIQVPLVNRGTLELNKGSTPGVNMMTGKMDSITNSGTLSIGADITLDRNISNSGTLNINGCLFSGEMTNSGTVTFKRVEGGTTAVCTITGTINNSGTVEIKEGNTFDTTAKVIGGILNLKGDYTFSNDNIQGLTELYVNGATYNFNAELGATPSVELIDAEKVTGPTLNLGTVTPTWNENLSEWKLGETKIAQYAKSTDNIVAVGNTAVVFSGDNYRFTFSQAKEADGTTNKIGYLGIIKENGGELWQIVRNTQVSGYHCGNVSTYSLTGDYTEQMKDATTDTDKLGTLIPVSPATSRTLTIEGNGHFFDGNGKNGITVGNADDVLNFNNISEINNWNSYVVTNNGGTVNFNNVTKLSSPVINTSGTVNFNGTTEVNNTLSGSGTFNNNGELTIINVANLTAGTLNNTGIVKIGDTGTLSTTINGGILGIVGNITADADKLAVNEIDIDEGKSLTVTGSTLGEMTMVNLGTLSLTVATNNAFAVGGTVNINSNMTTTQSILANEINLGTNTLTVTGAEDTTEFGFGKINANDGSELNITKGKVTAYDEVNSKIILGANVDLTIAADNIKKSVEIGTNANLNLGDGTFASSKISGTNSGTVNFVGNVKVDGSLSLPKATFANGSTTTLTVIAGGDAPLQVTDTISIDSGAKLFVSGATKGETFKIVSGNAIEDDFTGWTLDNIRGEDATGRNVKAKSFAVDSNVYSIVFKSALPENTDLGKLLENADGTPLADWAEKVCDYFDTAYGDAGEAYTANAINSMASASVLAGAQKEAATMVTQVAGNISANVGVGSRAILSGVRGQVSGVRNVSADVNDSASMRIDTVEQGKASEVMPTEYKDKVYDKQVWASYIHSKQKIDGLKTGSLTQNSTIQLNGVTVGADLWSGKKSFGGLAITYADGNANSAQMSNSTKNEAKYYGISMYHRQDMGKYALTTDIGYTYNKNDITQHTTGITDEVTSKPKTHAYTVGMKLEREIYLSKACKIVPFAGARYTRLQNRDFSNSLGANTKVDNQNLVTVPVGLSFHSHLVTTEGWKLGSILEGGYEWNFGNRHSTQEFGYGGAYNSIGFDVVDRGQYFVKAALTADYENMFFELGYRYSKGKSVRDNKWNFNANFIF